MLLGTTRVNQSNTVPSMLPNLGTFGTVSAPNRVPLILCERQTRVLNEWIKESMNKWDALRRSKKIWVEFLDSAFSFFYFMLSYLSVIIIRQAVLWWKAAVFSSVAIWTLGDAEGIKIRTEHTAVLSELLQHLCLTPHVEQDYLGAPDN